MTTSDIATDTPPTPEALLRNAKTLALMGVAILPFAVELLAFRRAERALEAYRSSGRDDPALEKSIRRVRAFSLLVAAVTWGLMIFAWARFRG